MPRQAASRAVSESRRTARVAPESCVALEDSYHGVRSAAGAGMMTIMVPDLFPPTDDMKELCVCIARDLHDVCTLIGAQPR